MWMAILEGAVELAAGSTLGAAAVGAGAGVVLFAAGYAVYYVVSANLNYGK